MGATEQALMVAIWMLQGNHSALIRCFLATSSKQLVITEPEAVLLSCCYSRSHQGHA